MREKIYILTLLLLTSATFAKVRLSGHIPDGSVMNTDKVEFKMTEIFDLSQAEGTLKFTATQTAGEGTGSPIGKVYDWNENFNTLQYPDQVFSMIKPIDDRSFILFNEAATGTYQEMTPDGSLPGNFWTHEYKVLSTAKVVCQDAILNHNSDELLIGCASKSSKLKQNSLYVARVNRKDGTVIDKPVLIDLKKYDFTFDNRLRMGLYTIAQGQKEPQLIIVYNQGNSNQKTSLASGHFFVFHYVNDELVAEDTEYTLGFAGSSTNKFSKVYDIYGYNDHLLVTASVNGKDNIQILSCVLLLEDENVICSDNMVDSGIKAGSGFLTYTEMTGFWAEFNIKEKDSGTLKLYQLNGKFSSEGWKTEIQSMDNVPTHDVEHQWIRGIEGDLHNAVIHWSGLNNDQTNNLSGVDVGSVLISWTLNKAKIVLGSTLTTLGDIGYFADIQKSDVFVRVIGKPFFYVEGSKFNSQETNVFTITATDKDNTVTATAHIHSQSSPIGKIILDFNPPYLDVFSGSTFKFPFTGDSWVAGNAVEFIANFADSHFQKPVIEHFGNTSVTFSPVPSSNNFDKIMFGDTGAVTIRSKEVNYYSCQYFHHGNALCQHKFLEKISSNAQHQDDVFSKHGVIGHWSITGSTTQIYIASFQGGSIVQNVNYVASSVAFTMDSDQNIFVAISQLDKGIVEIYEKKADIIKSWVKYQTHTAKSVGLDEFCPNQLRADPVEATTFHAMSLCQLKGSIHSVTRIVSLAHSKDSAYYGNSIVLSSGTSKDLGVVPFFCPMKDHHIIYIHGKSTSGEMVDNLYTVDKHQSFAKYTLNLKKAGFDYVSKFECFSDAQMYTIHGTNGGGIATLGLFWGNQKYNNKKFVNKIVTDIKTRGWTNVQSYYTGDYVIHVGYSNKLSQSFAATMTNPPSIHVKLEEFEGAYESIIPVEWNIKASNGFFKSEPIEGIINVRIANITIGFTNKKKWIANQGWIDIEDYTRIDGPVETVTLIGDDTQLRIKDRKSNRGAMDAKSSPTTFHNYRGNADDGVGLTIDGQSGTFYFIHNHEISGAAVKYGANKAYDFCNLNLIGGKAKLILYHGKNGPSDAISVFLTKNQRVRVEATVHIPKRATKMRIAPVGDNRRFLGFSYDHFGDNTLTIYSIFYNGENDELKIEIENEIRDVVDFDVCTQATTIYLYYIKSQSTKLDSTQFTYNGNYWDAKPLPSFIPNKKSQYWLTNVASAGGSNNMNHIAINTHGTVIYAGTISVIPELKSQNFNALNFGKLNKYEDFEGFDIYINEDYVVQKGKRMSAPFDSAALVWKRKDSDGYMHTIIHLKQDLPVTLFTHQLYGNTVGVGTLDENHPLQYYSVHNVELFVPKNYLDISFGDYSLKIEGSSYSQKVTVEDILSGDTPTPTPPGPSPVTPGYGYWPFVGVMIFLLLAAIIWFGCTKKEEADEEDPYKSVQPSSGVTEGAFESGLRPDEVVGEEYGNSSKVENRLAKAHDDEEENLKFD